MRVIAGTARGRRLIAPKGRDTRPTPDRVREALFSVLAGHLDGARVLDLFAGTGALGIEALSRGASRLVLVDHDRDARDAIEKNLAAVGPAQAELLPLNAHKALANLAARKQPFDLVLLDPPFASELLAWAVGALAENNLVSPGGIIVCEHASRDAPPVAPKSFVADAPRRYGEVTLTLLRHENGAIA